jgi:hypothetical protein
MLSRLRIFPTPPFSDSDILVENFLENTQKFYDGGAWTPVLLVTDLSWPISWSHNTPLIPDEPPFSVTIQ